MARVLQVENHRFIKNALDAVHYCYFECGNQRLGCANDCQIRIHFKIPPHGDKWSDERKKEELKKFEYSEKL